MNFNLHLQAYTYFLTTNKKFECYNNDNITGGPVWQTLIKYNE